MEFDVDAALSVLLPWDLKLRIGGKLFATKPPTVGQLAAIDQLAADKTPGSEAKFITLLRDLFEKPDEAMAKLTVPGLMIATRKIMKYAEEYSAKNSPAVAAAVSGATAIAEASSLKSGNS